MTLNSKAVKELQDIYQNKFGIKLNREEAEIRANNFLRLMMLICKQDPT